MIVTETRDGLPNWTIPLAELEEPPRPFDPRHEVAWDNERFQPGLLAEQLDPSPSGSRPPAVVDRHVRRLLTLLPPAATVLDAGCGVGRYTQALADAGLVVTGIDTSPAVISWARTAAQSHARAPAYLCADMRTPQAWRGDVVLLLHSTLALLPPRDRVPTLRALGTSLIEGGVILVEVESRPHFAVGHTRGWEVVEQSLLGSTPHLLLTELYVPRSSAFEVIRYVRPRPHAFECVSASVSLLSTRSLARLANQAGLVISAAFAGWTTRPANAASPTILAVLSRA